MTIFEQFPMEEVLFSVECRMAKGVLLTKLCIKTALARLRLFLTQELKT